MTEVRAESTFASAFDAVLADVMGLTAA